MGVSIVYTYIWYLFVLLKSYVIQCYGHLCLCSCMYRVWMWVWVCYTHNMCGICVYVNNIDITGHFNPIKGDKPYLVISINTSCVLKVPLPYPPHIRCYSYITTDRLEHMSSRRVWVMCVAYMSCVYAAQLNVQTTQPDMYTRVH